MELIFKSSDIIEAHIISNMLKANDIEAFVGGHYIQGGVGEFTGLNYASVFVPLKNINESKELIMAYENKTISIENPDDNLKPKSTIFKKVFIVLCCILLAVLTGYFFN